MVRTNLLVVLLFVGLAHAQNRLGQRETGDELVYVKYQEAESSTPANLLLHYFYDGRPKVARISAVECFEQRDSTTYNVVLIDGGAGNGPAYVEFSLEAVAATYHRAQCNFYGIYQ